MVWNTQDGVDSSFGSVMIAASCILMAVMSHIAYVGLKLEQEQFKLMKAQREYAGILRTTRDGFFVASPAGRLLDVNDRYCRMLGHTAEEMLQKHINGLEAEEDAASASGRLKRIEESGFDRFETRHRRKDGHLLDVEVSVTYMPAPNDGFLFFVRDITERKQFQSELERRVLARTGELTTARAEAEMANAVKTRFMANVSHEMLTPMHGILGYAGIGQRKAGKVSTETLAGYFGSILESGNRMRKLVESVLSLAEEAWNENSRVSEKDLRSISPQALVSQCIGMLEATARSRQQKIVLDNRAPEMFVRGDEPRLRQVFECLIGNALRYSPETTTVTLTIQNRMCPSVSGESGRDCISIQVADAGCGVPEQEMQAIFEPFYQSSRTVTGAGGSGLGLALCMNIVKRHQGTLSVRNCPEAGGAVFELTLPVAGPI